MCQVDKISDKSCRVLYFSHKMGTLVNGAHEKERGRCCNYRELEILKITSNEYAHNSDSRILEASGIVLWQ